MDKRHRQNGLADAASTLLTESSSDRFGLVSPSIYESARLVFLRDVMMDRFGRIVEDFKGDPRIEKEPPPPKDDPKREALDRPADVSRLWRHLQRL